MPSRSISKGKTFRKFVAKKIAERYNLEWKEMFIPKTTDEGVVGAKWKGDLIVHRGLAEEILFPFYIECKHYKKIDLYTLFKEGGIIYKWEKKARKEASEAEKFPLVIFKSNYIPAMVVSPISLRSVFNPKIYIKDCDKKVVIFTFDRFLEGLPISRQIPEINKNC